MFSPNKSVHRHGQVVLPARDHRWTLGLSETGTRSGICRGPPVGTSGINDRLNTHPPHTHPQIHFLVINTHIQLWQKFVSHQCWLKLQAFTFWPSAPSIFFHAPWPSTLVVTVKHYANKGQGTSGNANTSINNRLWLSSCQKRAGMFYPSTTMIQTLAHMHTHASVAHLIKNLSLRN